MDDIPIQCHKCQLDGIKPVSIKIYWLMCYYVIKSI
jgi:hypothetical protein